MRGAAANHSLRLGATVTEVCRMARWQMAAFVRAKGYDYTRSRLADTAGISAAMMLNILLERIGTSTHKELAAEGGLVFQTEVPMSFYLGDYWVSGDVDDIVPAAHLRHPVASVRQSALAALARWYPDQELVRCLTGDGVPSKDAGDPRTAFVATNHKKALSHHRLVHEMYAGEVEEERMLQFGLGQAPRPSSRVWRCPQGQR